MEVILALYLVQAITLNRKGKRGVNCAMFSVTAHDHLASKSCGFCGGKTMLDVKNSIRKGLRLTLALALVSVLSAGCSIPKRAYTLVAPAGLAPDREAENRRECLGEAQRLAQVPLTEDESRRIINVETGRFFESGRGRSPYSDRYVLCFLNRNYQLLEHPINWMPESNCERLSKYQSAGIEKERLKYYCETRYHEEKCDICQSLQ